MIASPAANNAPEKSAALAEDDQINSLFFSPNDIKRLRFAVELYEQKNGRGNASKATPNGENITQGVEIPSSEAYTYPQFFLESLVYHSPRDWFIWVNGQKITSDTAAAQTTLKIIAIDSNRVALAWLPPSMARVNATWDSMATHDDPSVYFDRANSRMEFTLRPNQTFSSYNMRVLEGKVLPVTENGVTNVVDLPAQSDKSAAKPSLPLAAAPPAAEPKQGLDGLLSAYQQLGHKP